MAYIGRQNLGGAYRQLDDISSGFDGSDTTHTMQVNSQNVTVGDVNQIILSLGGVIQKPGTDFTVSGSVLTFTTAPAANTSFFAVLLGSDNGGTVTPTDASVTTAKFASGVAIGATGTANTLAGIPFFSDTTNGSIYTHDVSGTDSTAADNTAFGLNALDAITTGDDNVAIGKNALSANNTGHSNVAVGADSQLSMTSGNTNTSIGNNALYSCTVGDRNTAVGANAFYALEPSSNSDMENTAIGFSAGRMNTTGDYNTFLGAQAGYSVTTGGNNTLIGRYAGANFDTEANNLAIGRNALSGASLAGAEHNVAIGNYSGDAVTSGDNNTFVGYNAGPTSTTAYLNVFIGKDAGTNNITGNNNVVIGAEAQTYDSDDFNQINIGHANPGIASNVVSLGIASTNQIYATFTSSASWTKSSDERIKKNITTNTKAGLDFINELRTVTYNKKRVTEFDPSMELYKATEDESDKLAYYDGTLYGLIAQEVKTAMDKHGIPDFDGWHEKEKGDKIQGIAESQFVIPLIKAVQELSAKVKALEEA